MPLLLRDESDADATSADPEGDFVECIGRQDTPDSATKVIMEHINDWKREGKPLKTE